MPSQILHTLFGEAMIGRGLRSIRSGIRGGAEGILEKIRGKYGALFTLGCQGPDIFYHSQFSRPVALEYGTLLHRRGFGSFAAELLRLTGPAFSGGVPSRDFPRGEPDALGVYALGFMTHGFLDRAAHPYIVYRTAATGGIPGRRGIHPFFERILDALMLEYLQGKAVSSWEGGDALAAVCADPPGGLKELLAEALIRTFPERAGRDGRLALRMDNTFTGCAAFYGLTNPRHTGGSRMPRAYLYPRRFPLDIDYLNLARKAWRHPAPGGGEEFRSFPDIYAGAVEAAAASFAAFMDPWLGTGGSGGAEEHIGNGGLSIRDPAGRPCAPVKTAPLPLDRVLAQQEALWGPG